MMSTTPQAAQTVAPHELCHSLKYNLAKMLFESFLKSDIQLEIC